MAKSSDLNDTDRAVLDAARRLKTRNMLKSKKEVGFLFFLPLSHPIRYRRCRISQMHSAILPAIFVVERGSHPCLVRHLVHPPESQYCNSWASPSRLVSSEYQKP
ncbi:hypothetical protein AA313_de0203486 [Arthrobotrys entomopaga]|nr:hypothetical protein AA313_de0203486 [Arthrobotrys entomopaga]